jgi:hypothetical protein
MPEDAIFDKLRICLDELRYDNPGKTFVLYAETIYYVRGFEQYIPVYQIIGGRVEAVYDKAIGATGLWRRAKNQGGGVIA